jgi:hypothetical protein
MKKKIIISVIICMLVCGFEGFNTKANADFMTVVDTVQRTSDAINAVNQAGRGIMSTTEFFQRFKDRRQENADKKRAEKAYNEAAKQEYDKTVNEINMLQQQYYNNSTNTYNIGNSENITEPLWSEFCQPIYEFAVFKNTKLNSKKYLENNYWALRRVKFQKAVLECKVLSKNQNDLSSCYSRVANLEQNKTNQRNEALYEKNSDTDREIQDGGYWWY